MRPLWITMILVSCSARYQGPKSDHFDGRVFFHDFGDAQEGFLNLLKWQLFDRGEHWAESAPELPAKAIDSEGVQLINHAAVLIDLDGQRILTDPHWGLRASPFDFVGPKRVRAPSVDIDQLGRIDAVLVSHNHYDHLSVETLLQLEKLYAPKILVPLGDAGWLREEGITNIEEVDWGEKRQYGRVEVEFVPVKHWSARGFFDRNLSLWGGFVIKGQTKTLYFAGDTAYFSGFKDYAGRQIDLAILPIGAYEPRWFMQNVHMNPEDAVKAHLDLKAKKSMGMHYAHWQLTNESIDAPLHDLKLAREKLSVDETVFIAPKPGDIIPL